MSTDETLRELLSFQLSVEAASFWITSCISTW